MIKSSNFSIASPLSMSWAARFTPASKVKALLPMYSPAPALRRTAVRQAPFSPRRTRRAIAAFSFALRRREKNAEIPRKSYTKWFDYDIIKGTLI